MVEGLKVGLVKLLSYFIVSFYQLQPYLRESTRK